MPSIGHVAVGLAAARLEPKPPAMDRNAWRLGLVALSTLPDLDLIAFALGIPYGASWGHRGAAHSLAVAALCGLACAAGARGRGAGAVRIGIVGGLVTASHGLLDTMTDGGLGIALLWPWSNHRFFAPWRPIPVAPLGAAMLTARGLEVVLAEGGAVPAALRRRPLAAEGRRARYPTVRRSGAARAAFVSAISPFSTR